MPVIQFKGKTAIESYHHTVPHHTLEFDPKLSVLPKGEKPSLDGNLIIEGDNLLALKALLPTHAGRIKCIYTTRHTTQETKAGFTTTISVSRSSKNGLERQSAKKARTSRVTTSGVA